MAKRPSEHSGFDEIYQLLKTIAQRRMSSERAGHTLQATALVHEAWMKVVASPGTDALDRSEFLSLASRAIRNILIDYARQHRSKKRGGSRRRITLDTCVLINHSSDVDYIDLDIALKRLATLDQVQAKLVELRFFSGLTMVEAANALGLSKRTAERHWSFARTWLRRELAEVDRDGHEPGDASENPGSL